MSRNVLVVEDDPDISDLVKLHLEDLGCAVTVANEGGGGLNAAVMGGPGTLSSLI